MGNPLDFIPIFRDNPQLLYLLAVWSMVWKGLSLWRAGERREKYWFLVLYVLNTLGVLEIIYLFYFSNKGKEIDG